MVGTTYPRRIVLAHIDRLEAMLETRPHKGKAQRIIEGLTAERDALVAEHEAAATVLEWDADSDTPISDAYFTQGDEHYAALRAAHDRAEEVLHRGA